MAYYRRQKGSKYNAIKTKIDGITFDSKKEAQRYTELKLLERSGLIRSLTLQPRFLLLEKYSNGKGEKIRAIYYVADFEYIDHAGRRVVEDVKSSATATPVYKLKKKLFEKKYFPLTVTEI